MDCRGGRRSKEEAVLDGDVFEMPLIHWGSRAVIVLQHFPANIVVVLYVVVSFTNNVLKGSVLVSESTYSLGKAGEARPACEHRPHAVIWQPINPKNK